MLTVSRFSVAILVAGCAFIAASCSSPMPVKKQAYAELKSERTFENEFPEVWKAIEAAFRNHRIEERDPAEVDPIELKRLRERRLRTDWIFSQSRDKYVEYKVNDFPRKKYLQLKVRYTIVAKAVMGGIHVSVSAEEEIENLNPDGSSAGYSPADKADSGRAAEILDRINGQLLGAPNT